MTSLVEISEVDRKIAAKIDSAIAGGVAVAGGLRFHNSGQVMEFAKAMAVSDIGVRKHLRGNPGACLAVVVQALEWGFSPYAVANKSYLVNDQIAYESQLIQAVILSRAPIRGRIRFTFEGNGEKRICIATATLADGTGEVEYRSPEFGKIQPKNSPLWKNDPDQQHCYYSGRAMCRRYFPDVILGVYDVEELMGDGAGPERVRDVTPPRPRLTAALGAIGGKPPEVEHDPETGEIAPGFGTAGQGGGERSAETAGGAKPSEKPAGAGNAAGATSDAADGKKPAGDDGAKERAASEGKGEAPETRSPQRIAFDEGVEAKGKGRTVNAMPPHYAEPGAENLRSQWRAGHGGKEWAGELADHRNG